MKKGTVMTVAAVLISALLICIAVSCGTSADPVPTPDTAEGTKESVTEESKESSADPAEVTVVDTTEEIAEDTTEEIAEVTSEETTEEIQTNAEPVLREPTAYDDGIWNLLLVNPDNPLPDGFAPQLSEIGGGHYADRRVVDALNKMLGDCRAAGLSPLVCSSYRTYQKQESLFENKTNQYMGYGYTRDMAEAYASMWVARPGTSEHHTGLAFDIVASDYQVLDSSQASTEVQKWLMANCHKYGFILRYPEDKEMITDIHYEPWHYRYVGVEAATDIMSRGICLEEYLLEH